MLDESKIATATSECLFICRQSNTLTFLFRRNCTRNRIRCLNSVPFHVSRIYGEHLDRSSRSTTIFQLSGYTVRNRLSMKSRGLFLAAVDSLTAFGKVLVYDKKQMSSDSSAFTSQLNLTEVLQCRHLSRNF